MGRLSLGESRERDGACGVRAGDGGHLLLPSALLQQHEEKAASRQGHQHNFSC